MQVGLGSPRGSITHLSIGSFCPQTINEFVITVERFRMIAWICISFTDKQHVTEANLYLFHLTNADNIDIHVLFVGCVYFICWHLTHHVVFPTHMHVLDNIGTQY
jgi:hypothetical protein